ncbi:MAG: hypothetical protein KAR19_03700 [Bacteroidales bacterium]|nr:hypothetical protein [Bacteroidales bacterium]
MDPREKLRAFNQLLDDKFYEPDYALLKKKSPKHEALTIHAPSAKLHREALFGLLDLATTEQIEKNRKEYLKKVEAAAKKAEEAAVKKAEEAAAKKAAEEENRKQILLLLADGDLEECEKLVAELPDEDPLKDQVSADIALLKQQAAEMEMKEEAAAKKTKEAAVKKAEEAAAKKAEEDAGSGEVKADDKVAAEKPADDQAKKKEEVAQEESSKKSTSTHKSTGTGSKT